MKTFIYMIRHGDSPKEGNERTRVLTEKGIRDAQQVTRMLKNEGINTVVSSPYIRSVLTVEPLAKELGQEVVVIENLKEKVSSADDIRVSDKELMPLLIKSFSEPHFALEGAESNAACQQRAAGALNELLKTYAGQKIALGTHGIVMTLMMNYYDEKYDLDFLHSTSKPDIYKMVFDGEELVEVHRLWDKAEVCF
ncbi:histidine phosphatase family protein [Rossellomorea aquimaris]|uniref:Phosphoglycerate mutase n=1 Tax=Rossellomorea aquimaris TaxID=189382 RepID=A0A1J6WLY1_9BACI|nr:histidine phosphatase family protein [Rossellomorea aquimaris]OIU72816.1 phosphoglycerate mutase [Rossellomorea aquimaris]